MPYYYYDYYDGYDSSDDYENYDNYGNFSGYYGGNTYYGYRSTYKKAKKKNYPTRKLGNGFPNQKIEELKSEKSNGKYLHMYKIPEKSGRYIVTQLDTSGYNCSTDSIKKIYALEVVDGVIRNKYTKKFEENQKETLEEFLRFVGNSQLVAHEAIFLKNFLNKALERYGLQTLGEDKFLCTMRMFLENRDKGDSERINIGDSCHK